MTKRALVTGSSGLLGRHTATALTSRGWHVDACVDSALGHQQDARTFFSPATRHRTTYDLVVHCAARIGGRAGIDGNPAALAATNLQLDGALFEWALRTRPARIIYWSSAAAYPTDLQGPDLESWTVANGEVTTKPGARPLRETDIDLDNPRLPDASYGAVKLVGENLARWARAEGLRVHVFRPFSGWSADQDPDYPMRAFLDRARRRDDPFDVWGPGTQVRDWIHITDVVGAALAAVDQDYDGPLNLCTGEGTSFDELATMMCGQAGYTPTLRHHPDKPTGVHYRVGDPSEMARVYRPKVTLEQGIKQALAD